MTWIDRTINRNSKALLFGFVGLVVTSVGLAMVISRGNDATSQEILEDPVNEDISKDPEQWSEAELRAWLKKRFMFPPEDVSKEELIRLVHSYRAE